MHCRLNTHQGVSAFYLPLLSYSVGLCCLVSFTALHSVGCGCSFRTDDDDDDDDDERMNFNVA